MAFGTRGLADRDAFIDYVDTLDVPASWRKPSAAVLLAANPIEPRKAPKAKSVKRRSAKKV